MKSPIQQLLMFALLMAPIISTAQWVSAPGSQTTTDVVNLKFTTGTKSKPIQFVNESGVSKAFIQYDTSNSLLIRGGTYGVLVENRLNVMGYTGAWSNTIGVSRLYTGETLIGINSSPKDYMHLWTKGGKIITSSKMELQADPGLPSPSLRFADKTTEATHGEINTDAAKNMNIFSAGGTVYTNSNLELQARYAGDWTPAIRFKNNGTGITNAWIGADGSSNLNINATSGHIYTNSSLHLPANANIISTGQLNVGGTAGPLLLLGATGTIVSKAWGGSGNLNVEGNLTFAANSIITSPGRLHISGEEILYLLNKSGVAISKAWGGTGNLSVEGTLLTSRVKVAVVGSGQWSWADYVFDQDYKLRPLEEVDNFIKQHKHLPNIPSAGELKKNGYDMAEMDSKLLEKIEELTLYLLQLKKDNEALQQQVQQQAARINSLESFSSNKK